MAIWIDYSVFYNKTINLYSMKLYIYELSLWEQRSWTLPTGEVETSSDKIAVGWFSEFV